MTAQDIDYMHQALNLARGGVGFVAPNPSVGCVLVQGLNEIVGVGATGLGGRPHAETQALQKAGSRARGATAYVTLEPCCVAEHKPISCAQALIEAGVKRVVVATLDPSLAINGRGVHLLQQAGIRVDVGLCQEEAELLNVGFFTLIREKRPFVALKMASTLDGAIAQTAQTGQHWLSGSQARSWVHETLRPQYDAIMVGVGTALKDNPRLTIRQKREKEKSRIRIVADSHLRLPETSILAQTARQFPLWVITLAQSDYAKRKTLERLGVICVELESMAVKTMLQALAQKGITRLLLEGGRALATSFLRESCIDSIYWISAPILFGEGNVNAIGTLPNDVKLDYKKSTILGQDILLEYGVRK